MTAKTSVTTTAEHIAAMRKIGNDLTAALSEAVYKDIGRVTSVTTEAEPEDDSAPAPNV